MNGRQKDYYQILELPRNASQEEIKKQYRKLGKANHPDAGSANATNEERLGKEEKMRELNEAYECLSNPSKRRIYDRETQVNTQASHGAEGTNPANNSRGGGSLSDFFEDFFGFKSNRQTARPRDNYDGGYGRVQPEGFIAIPETDWGLLAALKRAYSWNRDGRWFVNKPKDDQRNWMPDTVYLVTKVGTEVTVHRRIVDWRSDCDRGNNIKIKSRNGKIEEFGWGTFIHEANLSEKGRQDLENWTDIPFQFGEYLSGLKELAYMLSEQQKTCVGISLNGLDEEINRYGRLAKNTDIEGSLYPDEKNREPVMKVPLSEVWPKINGAERNVGLFEGSYGSGERRRY